MLKLPSVYLYMRQPTKKPDKRLGFARQASPSLAVQSVRVPAENRAITPSVLTVREMPEDDPGLVTQMLEAVSEGKRGAEEDLFRLVYEELRRMAHSRMASENPGQTLQPTALVHEVYLRLLHNQEPRWDNRAHFFTAAADAMRRILVERARRKSRLKRGGDRQRVELGSSDGSIDQRDETLLALDHALARLEEVDPAMARVVKLRYFAGLTVEEVARALGITERTVYRRWLAARTWLHRELATQPGLG